jgi:non-reducing end alpha-L-arabinofuranosidase
MRKGVDQTAELHVIITSQSAEMDKRETTWIVRRGFAKATCLSLESKSNPGEFLRQQKSQLRIQPFDGTVQNRFYATFCKERGKSGIGISLFAVNLPSKYLRHYFGKLYLANIGGDAEPWDASSHKTEDTSWVVASPWSP